MKNQLGQIKEWIDGHQAFAVLSHIRPDGDAYGTSIALALVLRALGKEVVVYNQDGLTRNYLFLPGKELVQKTPATPPPESTGLIAVDTSTLERLGATFTAWGRPPGLNIDHHPGNPGYGTINLIDGDSPASSQVVYELIEALGLPCPPEAAFNLYIGLMTDTGSFRFRQTTARTFEVASALVTRGADPAAAAQSCFQSSSAQRFQLQSEVLASSQFVLGNRVAYYRLTSEMYQRTGAQADEVENFLELLQAVSTIEVAFMLEEIAGGGTRVSLRSRGRVDVNAIAAKFGGGGHRLAAGIRSTFPIDRLEADLLREIEAALQPFPV